MAVISNGTLPNAKVVVGTLSNMVERVKREQLQRPTLIIVGEVVGLRDILGFA